MGLCLGFSCSAARAKQKRGKGGEDWEIGNLLSSSDRLFDRLGRLAPGWLYIAGSSSRRGGRLPLSLDWRAASASAALEVIGEARVALVARSIVREDLVNGDLKISLAFAVNAISGQ